MKAESFLQLLKFHNGERFLYHLAEIRNSNSRNEVEGHEPEPIGKTMIVLDLSEWLRMTEAGIRLFVDNDCKVKLAAAAGQRITRMFACLVEKILMVRNIITE